MNLSDDFVRVAFTSVDFKTYFEEFITPLLPPDVQTNIYPSKDRIEIWIKGP